MARLKEKCFQEILPQMKKDFGYTNDLQAPRLDKIVVNIGLGEAIQNIKATDHALDDLSLITGQKPIITRAKKSISNFKLRDGMPIGCSVTLRRLRMWSLLDRLIAIAIPRIRDFRGLSANSFDGRGNYSFGLTEQLVFPEIEYDKIPRLHGMDITIVTSAKNDEEGRELLSLLGMPFRK